MKEILDALLGTLAGVLVVTLVAFSAERFPLDRPAATDAEPVKGRAPGLSEHASPFGQTEARAERTLERPPDKTASTRECGAAPPPRAPEPSAARVG